MKLLDNTSPHKVELLSRTVTNRNIIFWLNDNIGKSDIDWFCEAGWPLTNFYFKDAEDAVAFKLRWL